MKRSILKLCLFLLLGAIINIAVAWGCVLMNSTNHRPRQGWGVAEQATAHGPEPWEYMMWDRGGIQIVWWLHRSSGIEGIQRPPSPSWSDPPQLSPEELVGYDGWHFVQLAAGWPLLSMTCRGGCSGQFSTTKGSFASNGIELAQIQQWREQRMLPLKALWPGFAINTIFYVAILWMLFALPFALRRRRRIKRGLCPSCGYDLRGHESDQNACPECGLDA